MKQLQKTAKLLCWPSKRNNYKRQRNYCVNLLSETITKDSEITVTFDNSKDRENNYNYKRQRNYCVNLLSETITKDSEITDLLGEPITKDTLTF